MNKFLCIHGHFYQPPRENPWLEEVEHQDSAYPFHDWNERITDECYAPNSAARILGPNGMIVDIKSNYSRISHNFGPTLLSWMERKEPDIYKQVIEADQISRERFSGHGSALAQCYNHIIMPLANKRDKKTQVYWAVKDFERHYGRKPEGIWLPETAANTDTLEVLVDHEIRFTILAPRQAKRFRKMGEKQWMDTGLDPRRPYVCHLPSGRDIILFFYDGPVSQGVAFEHLLENGEKFADRLLGVFTEENGDQLVHIATDGETYGHHHRDGDMALAYGLHHIEDNNLAALTIYAEYLEKHPPEYEAEIIEDSSWSCVHGIDRWRDDCGCHSGGHPHWNQQWRAPLRGALDWLRDNLISVFENETKGYLKDCWAARDEYIDVINSRTKESVAKFLSVHASKELTQDEKVKVLTLLEMQRHAMLMYTSCGWFFDEVSGIETVQILTYASRAIQLAESAGHLKLEQTFVNLLERVPSNIEEFKNGKVIYERFVKPAIVDLLRVGAHYAISSIFEDYKKRENIFCFKVKSENHEMFRFGKQSLVVGKVRITSLITLEETMISYAVLHFGDHNFIGGVRSFMDDEKYELMRREVEEAFNASDIPLTIHMIEKYFENYHYSLWNLFRDEQTKILYQILDSSLEEVESSLRKINANHFPMAQVLRQKGIALPKVLANTYLATVNADIIREIESKDLDLDKLATLVTEMKAWKLDVDQVTLQFKFRGKIDAIMEDIQKSPEDITALRLITRLFEIIKPLNLALDLWKAQNIFFYIGKKTFPGMAQKSNSGDGSAREWVDLYHQLGQQLNVTAVP